MHVKALEDRLLQYIPLQTATHSITQQLKKQVTHCRYQFLTPTQQNLLRSFFQCTCEACKMPLEKAPLLEAYQEKNKLGRLLCEDCRTILQIAG